MTLNIKNPEAYQLAQELSKATGKTMTSSIIDALKDKLDRVNKTHLSHHNTLAESLDEIALHCASLPHLDDRSSDMIIEYDENGLPG